MNRKDIHTFFERFRQRDPVPETELHYTTPFTFLVAVILSAQATDKGVNKATPALFKAADTPEKMQALGVDGIRPYIKSLGFFNNKAKNLHALSERLVAEFQGKIPRDRIQLESLPGVGRKTANVFLNVIEGAPVVGIDTHVFRLSNRCGLAPGKTAAEVEKKLESRLSPQHLRHANHWLVLHGRYVCKARKPLCGDCILRDLCEYPDKTE